MSGGQFLLVEVAFTAHEEMAGRVVVGPRVTDGAWRPVLVDIAIEIDEEVIRNVRPASINLVEVLVDPNRSGSVRVLPQESCGVVDGQALELMARELARRGTRSPRLAR